MPLKKKTDPEIIRMPAEKMAVVRGKGAPDKVFEALMPALYGAVYGLKFALKKKGIEYKVRPPRARYPDAPLKNKSEWSMEIGVPVPADTTELLQKKPDIKVELETWEYGTAAQILHIGSYAEETPNIEKLLQFIKEQGYTVTGSHEEEYLTMPTSKIVKTIIRYPVKKL